MAEMTEVTLYKLTDRDGYTRREHRNQCKWGPGVTHEALGALPARLCTDAWIHAYTDLVLAVMMDPIGGQYGSTAQLWEATGTIGAADGTKVGCRQLTTVRRVDIPEVTTIQRVRFGILAALAVCTEAAFGRWAQAWLDGTDRTSASAQAAYSYAGVHAAAHAAYAAAEAAEAAYAGTYAAVEAADASAHAANAAASAAACGISLTALAHQAVDAEAQKGETDGQ